MSNNQSFKQTLIDLFAGTVAGVAQVLSGQPFDIVKVRLQTQTNGQYKGAMDCVSKIIKNEGLLSFYKGTLSPLVGIGFCCSIQFSVNEGMKRFFNLFYPQDEQGRLILPLSMYFISGAVAGTANSVVSIPVEHIRIKLQIQQGDQKIYSGSGDATKKIFQKYGMKGLFQGGVFGVAREFLGYGFYFLGYEAIKKFFTKQNKEKEWYVPIIGGGAAGLMMWLSVYPIDVVKSKMQADSFENPQFKSLKQCLEKTSANGGMKNYFKGIGPCLVRSVPVNVTTFIVFEEVLKIFKKLEQKNKF